MLHFRLLATIAFVFLLTPLWSQVNVKVGYNIGYTNPSSYNFIYQHFNKEHPWLTQSFKDLHVLNGLQLGLRYRLENDLALEVNWQNQYHLQTATGIDPISNLDFSQRISFRYGSLGLGLEYFLGSVSFGASYNFDQMRYNLVASNIKAPSLVKGTGSSSHFFVSYNVEGSDFFHLSIRPYIQMSWQPFQLAPVLWKLSGVGLPGRFEEGFNTIGIMLLFYNGKK